jgi:hypothetical protein
MGEADSVIERVTAAAERLVQGRRVVLVGMPVAAATHRWCDS